MIPASVHWALLIPPGSRPSSCVIRSSSAFEEATLACRGQDQSRLPGLSCSTDRSALPFVLDVPHQERRVELHGSLRKQALVGEEARVDVLDCEWFGAPPRLPQN